MCERERNHKAKSSSFDPVCASHDSRSKELDVGGVYVSLNKCESGGVVYFVYGTTLSLVISLKPERTPKNGKKK
jgi:hypothetical protein